APRVEPDADADSTPIRSVEQTTLDPDRGRQALERIAEGEQHAVPTELTRRLGDRGAYRVVSSFHDDVLRASAPHGGKELELRGDGVLLAFRDPLEGLTSSIGIQRRLLDAPNGRRVSVRIGLHAGRALEVEHGYFGSNVILSARLAEVAAPGEVLASGAVVKRLTDAATEAGRWVSLKGIPEPHLVFPIPWRTSRAPVAEPPCTSAALEALLAALDRGRETYLTPDSPSCMLGRRSAV
ncbi:MAG: adenylate/guanylate cyclase domain-containing protein, partial [Myxococcota bacterium]